MATISHRLRLVYLPIPKNACTSVKTMFFEAETGRNVDTLRTANGRVVHVHAVYPSVPDGGVIPDGIADYDVIAVLRDPVKRFVSGYRNRIQELRDIDRAATREPRIAAALAAKELPTSPDIDTFALKLADYMQAVPIVRHHFLPQTAFVSKAIDALTVVVGIDQVERIAALLAERAGQPVEAPRKQVSRVPIDAPPSDATLALLRDFYAEDYPLLERFGLAAD